MILSSVREVLWKRSVGVLKINKRTPPPEFVGAAVRAKYTYYRALPGKKTPYDLLESKAKEAKGVSYGAGASVCVLHVANW